MRDTKTLITHLSSKAHRVAPLKSARYWVGRLIVVLAIYAAGIQCFLGSRPDLAMQLTRPSFAGEILLLTLLLLTSVVASVVAMVPDSYQKPKLLMLPYLVLALLSAWVLFQLFLPPDARMVMPEPGAHRVECALCIAMVALVPSAVIFALLRKGASVRQYQSGSFAVLAASSVGCLTLRFAEVNDSIVHLVSWHYLPTLLFALLGALIGKWLLRW